MHDDGVAVATLLLWCHTVALVSQRTLPSRVVVCDPIDTSPSSDSALPRGCRESQLALLSSCVEWCGEVASALVEYFAVRCWGRHVPVHPAREYRTCMRIWLVPASEALARRFLGAEVGGGSMRVGGGWWVTSVAAQQALKHTLLLFDSFYDVEAKVRARAMHPNYLREG